jgi:hypothetical protein
MHMAGIVFHEPSIQEHTHRDDDAIIMERHQAQHTAHLCVSPEWEDRRAAV